MTAHDAAAQSRPAPARAVLLAALSVVVLLLVRRLLDLVPYVVTDSGYGQDPLGYLRLILGATLPGWFAGSLALGGGVALAWGTFLRIRADQRMTEVVLRSLGALLVGAAAALLVLGVVLGAQALQLAGPRLWGASLGEILPRALAALRGGVSQSVGLVADALLAVPLAGLLLWGWLRRRGAAPLAADAPAQV